MTDFSDKPTIVGERVILRPMVAEDADSMYVDADDPESTRLTGSREEFTLEAIRRWTATRADTVDRLDLAVVDAMSRIWLGEVVINEWDAHNRSCNFRIALSATARNRGVGTEATRLIVDYLFDVIDDPPVHRIELEVYSFNPRAKAVYERVGFRHEGTRRQSLLWDGEYVDADIMSILRTDRS